MKGRIEKKVIAVLLILLMCLTLLPKVTLADSLTYITEVEATVTGLNPTYGGDISLPTFTVTKGEPAYFWDSIGTANWEIKEGDTWTEVTSGKFTEGKWRYETQVCINPSFDTTNEFDSTLSVKVNGKNWDVSHASSTVVWVTSEEFDVREPEGLPLSFEKQENFDIPISEVGHEIYKFFVKFAASGGKRPYKFSKTSGPDWLNVSETGEVSGSPAAVGKNDNLVIRVTDADSNYKEIGLSVGDTVNLTKLSEVEATVTGLNPTYGGEINRLTFTVTKGNPVYFYNKEDKEANWEKREGDSWIPVQSGTFTEGKWRYTTSIWIDPPYNTTYGLDDHLTVKVNGNSWDVSSQASAYAVVNSPVYLISKTADSKNHDIVTVEDDKSNKGETSDRGSSGGGRKSGGGGSRKSSGNVGKTKKTGTWQQDATGRWYKHADGSYSKSAWESIDGSWYAFNEAGYMRTGWFLSGDKWYMLGSSGAMSVGWIQDNGKWYYLNPASGEMLIGWQNIDGKYYYFNTDNLRPLGSMYVDEKTPDGYRTNSSGEWVQ